MSSNHHFFAKLWRVLKNKYVATVLIFGLFIVFFDENSLLVIHRLRKQVGELHDEENQLRDAIQQDSISFSDLQNDIDAVERYGRENYFLKRTDEDVYVFED